MFSRKFRPGCLLVVVALAVCLVASQAASRAAGDDEPAEGAGFFFKVAGAKDCVFDQQRQRLFVTNERQLVVLDTKERKTLKSIELPGIVRACDISPDFKHLAVAALKGQFFYWIDLENLEVSQVRFKADADETGVFDLCVGADGSVLFSMVFLNSEGAASGWVKLHRFDPKTNEATEVGRVRMDTVVSASGDRKFAVAAEGNISSGPLQLYDFQSHELHNVTNTQSFIYEIACSSQARYFARPNQRGCELYDVKGTQLGNLAGKPVICAAFHPQADRLFVMRHGETSIQEYDITSQKVLNEYPLESALEITGTATDHVVANLHPIGRSTVQAHFSRVRSVHFRTFQSGRVRVSDDGKHLFVVVPTGVYMFDTKQVKESADTAPKFKVIEAK